MARPIRDFWGVLACAVWLGALSTRTTLTQASSQAPASLKEVATADEVKLKCGSACHLLPPPDILPRASWRDELVRMMLIQEGVPEPAGASGFIPLPPDWIRLLRYFEANAPVRLAEPEPWPAVDPNSRLKLARRGWPALNPGVATAIANARFLDIDADGKLDVVATDMRSGPVLAALAKDGFALKQIARLRHPSHIEQLDLNKDGLKDLLIADLGSFQPADHQNGSVYLAPWTEGRHLPADSACRGAAARRRRARSRLRRGRRPRHRPGGVRVAQDR